MSKQLVDAHEHGNCILCDDLEHQLAEAQGKLDAVRALARRRRKPRRLLEDVRELIDRLVEGADDLTPFARRTRRALDRILHPKEGE
jgi:hypothetical protein